MTKFRGNGRRETRTSILFQAHMNFCPYYYTCCLFWMTFDARDGRVSVLRGCEIRSNRLKYCRAFIAAVNGIKLRRVP